MEVFTQFSSDLDDTTRSQLKQGQILMELLKQPLGHPMSLSDEVITLTAAQGKKLLDLPVEQVKDFQAGLLQYIAGKNPDLPSEIEKSGILDAGQKQKILDLTDEYKAQRSADAAGEYGTDKGNTGEN